MKKLEKKYLIPGIVLLLWLGIFSFVNGNCQSFWADELASIGFIRNGLSIPEVLNTYLYRENNLLCALQDYALWRTVSSDSLHIVLHGRSRPSGNDCR